MCRRACGYSGYSGYGLQTSLICAHIAGMAADEDLPSCSLPPKRKGAKPKPRKRTDADVPFGDKPKATPRARAKAPAKSRAKGKAGKPSRAEMEKAEAEKAKDPFAGWDPRAEALAARDTAIGKLKHKASVPISPPVERKAGKRKREVVEHTEVEGPMGGRLKRSRKVVEPAAAGPAPRTAREILKGMRGEKRPPVCDDLFVDVCALLAAGMPLRQICRLPDMPTKDAIYRFLDDETVPEDHARRLARYARARKIGFDDIAEEALEIIDDGTNDYMERERDGETETVLDREHIQRSKLRFEGRMKLLAVWDPGRYGDKLALSDPNGNPLGSAAREASISDMAIGLAKIMEAHRRLAPPPDPDMPDGEYTDVTPEA